jgi:hypothetical protein
MATDATRDGRTDDGDDRDGRRHTDPNDDAATPEARDIVEEAGVESFPTSDPPSWTRGIEDDRDDDEEDDERNRTAT